MTRGPKTYAPTSRNDAQLDAALEVLIALIARQVAKEHQQAAQTEERLTDDHPPQA